MSGEKTEEPTQKKLDDARKEGQLPQRKNVIEAVFLTFSILLLIGLTGRISEAMLSIHNEPFRSPERAKLIHSLTGCDVKIEGQLEENLPTLPSKTDHVDYQSGRTFVLRLTGEGGLVEVLISNHDSKRTQYATYGDPQALRGVVMGWCDRFDRPQIACQKFLSR